MAAPLSAAERELLRTMLDSHTGGAFAISCDGKDRAIAHRLEDKGLAKWKGETFGSQFWAITSQGIERITAVALKATGAA